jgi:hypothetical protein
MDETVGIASSSRSRRLPPFRVVVRVERVSVSSRMLLHSSSSGPWLRISVCCCCCCCSQRKSSTTIRAKLGRRTLLILLLMLMLLILLLEAANRSWLSPPISDDTEGNSSSNPLPLAALVEPTIPKRSTRHILEVRRLVNDNDNEEDGGGRSCRAVVGVHIVIIFAIVVKKK